MNYMKKVSTRFTKIVVFMLTMIAFHLPLWSISIPFEVRNAVYPATSEEQKCMLIDKQGLIWIGSDNGIKTYDGYLFKTYCNHSKSPRVLPSNNIRCMAEDHDDGIWIGTEGGLARMDKTTQRFTIYQLPVKTAGKSVFPLFTASNGDVWMGYDNLLVRYTRKNKKFKFYHQGNTQVIDANGKKHSLDFSDIQSFAEDRQGTIYLGTWQHGIYRIGRQGRTLYQLRLPKGKNIAAHTMLIDRKGRLWIGTWGEGVCCLNTPSNTTNPGYTDYSKHSPEFSINYHLIEDPTSKTIWTCTRDGIGFIQENHLNEGFTYLKNIGIRKEYPVQSTMDLATDGKGSLWALTLNQGLLHLSTQPSIFQMHDIDTDRLTINGINSISTNDGTHLWMALAPAGIALYNKDTKKALYNQEIPGLQGIPYNIINTHANSIMQKGANETWIAIHGYGIIHIKNGKAILWNNKNCKFVKSNYVKSLLTSKRGITFVGENGWLNYILPSGEIINKKLDASVSNIQEDHLGRIWVSTEDKGIICIHGDFYHPSKLKLTNYNLANQRLDIPDVTNCIEDAHHHILAISKSGGLYRYNLEKDKFDCISNLFPGKLDRAFSIVKDPAGHIWITTDDALTMLYISKKGNLLYNNYTSEDGLGSMFFQANSCFQFGNQIYLGSGKELVCVNATLAQAPQSSKSPYNIIVTDLLLNDKRLATIDSTQRKRICEQSPSYMRRIVLPPSIYKFGVEFAMLSYSNPKQCKYAYLLEGYNDKWQTVSASYRQATFENLPSGTYHLHLKAADSRGRWSKLPYSIEIKILPPWYASWWAYIIYIGIAILAIHISIRWYRARIRTKNRLQMANVFTNITHELLTPLSIISAAADSIQQGIPSAAQETGIIHSNIDRLSRMLRQILEVRKSQAGKLKLQVSKGNLRDFCQQTINDIMPMFVQKNIQLDSYIDIQESEIEEWFDEDKLEKILYNLLSNAAKYTPMGGKAKLSVRTQDDQACISVSDTGIGMSANKLRHLYQRFLDGDYRQMQTVGTGLGLSLVKDLVKLHHGTIKCKSKKGKGTTFTLHIPINKNCYEPSEITQTKKMTRHEEAVQAIAGTHSILPRWDEEKSKKIQNDQVESDEEYTILLVEDNMELLALMSRLLGTRYHIKTASNGEKAQRIIQKAPLDIVVTDVMMPVLDGIELTYWIKNSKEYAQLPVIMLTAKTKGDDRNEGYRVGADDYITKPFNIADLQVRIDNIIANRKRIKERFQMQTEYKVEEQHYSNPDEIFLKNAIRMVLSHITESDYGREDLAADLCVSGSTLYNKLRAITGTNISSFINSIRMKEACKILKQTPDIRIAVLAVKVGFATPRYFSQCFKKEFGMTVREYADSIGKEKG